ncbi:MAG: glycosyltransferase family 2 protein [Planctomycetota bacterium]
MLSVVVPILNEKETLGALVRQVMAATGSPSEQELEILLVDDGSSDGTWQVFESLANSTSHVRGIRFRRNFGKAAALSAGFAECRGSVVITMDADLQDDPKEIPRLIAKLDEGYDVVSGWKQTRHDPWHKRWPSLVFNAILRYFSRLDLHDFNCGFKAYRREVLREIDLFGEMHRFIPVLAAARGFRVSEVPVEHHPRRHGVSKYGWSRIPKGLMDLLTVVFLTRFRYRPQHLLGGLGSASCVVGVLVLLGLCIAWIWTRAFAFDPPLHLHERAAFYLAILMILAGLHLIGVGLLAELVVANSMLRHSPYSIAERVGSPDSDTAAL